MGNGGLGKTTLAVQVCRNLQVQFDFQATVLMSRNFDMRRILRAILFQTEKKDYQYQNKESCGEDVLIQELRKFLEDERYLIIALRKINFIMMELKV